jgi:hypothetical protein
LFFSYVERLGNPADELFSGSNHTFGRLLLFVQGSHLLALAIDFDAARRVCARSGTIPRGVCVLEPDLIGASNRYKLHDLVENIVKPSKVISDQYESSTVRKLDT